MLSDCCPVRVEATVVLVKPTLGGGHNPMLRHQMSYRCFYLLHGYLRVRNWLYQRLILILCNPVSFGMNLLVSFFFQKRKLLDSVEQRYAVGHFAKWLHAVNLLQSDLSLMVAQVLGNVKSMLILQVCLFMST